VSENGGKIKEGKKTDQFELSSHPSIERICENMFETITSTTANPAPTWMSLLNVTSVLVTTATGFVDLNNVTTTPFSNVTVDGSDDGSDNNGSSLLQPCLPESPNFNCSVKDYLEQIMGLKQMPLPTAIWVSAGWQLKCIGIFRCSSLATCNL
jgi:hypothetical protein